MDRGDQHGSAALDWSDAERPPYRAPLGCSLGCTAIPTEIGGQPARRVHATDRMDSLYKVDDLIAVPVVILYVQDGASHLRHRMRHFYLLRLRPGNSRLQSLTWDAAFLPFVVVTR